MSSELPYRSIVFGAGLKGKKIECDTVSHSMDQHGSVPF